jgi:hypothetical protein
MNGAAPPRKPAVARPTENITFGAGMTTAAFAGDVADLLNLTGPGGVRLVAIAFAVLPRAITWLVDQYRNYWPALRRVPRPGRHAA